MRGMFPAKDKQIRERNDKDNLTFAFLHVCFAWELVGNVGVHVPVGSLFLQPQGAVPSFSVIAWLLNAIENPTTQIRQYFGRSRSENWQISSIFFSVMSWCHPEPLVHFCYNTFNEPFEGELYEDKKPEIDIKLLLKAYLSLVCYSCMYFLLDLSY